MKTNTFLSCMCIFVVYAITFSGGVVESQLATLKKRVGIIEKRMREDIAMLREEFDLEIINIKQTHKFVDLPAIRNGILASIHNKERNTEQAVPLEMLEDLEKEMLAKFAQLTGGFQSEKVWRRDVQRQLQLEHRITEDIVRVLSEGKNMSSHFGQMCLNLVEGKMDTMIEILSEIKIQNEKPDTQPAVDCADLYRRGHVTNGLYTVFPRDMWRPLHVYCDMETDGGGWTVFQRRCDGSENFTRSWNDYRFGFGNLSSEFWLGNEYVSRMTSQGPQELRIELEDFENDRRYAKYALFEMAPFSEHFKLTIEDFSGNVTDSLARYHNDRPFSTFDKGPSASCAKSNKGGFWYNNCHAVNINGLYLKGEHKSYANGVNWKEFRGYHYSLKFTEMKFRLLEMNYIEYK